MTFSCSLCGECCNSILIRVESDKAAELNERPWVRQRLLEFSKVISPETAEHWLIPHKPDKTCVFLGDERQCMIEQHEGKRLKPAECLSFPFAGVRLPHDNSHTTQARLFDCSASCKRVAEDLLETFATILPETDWAQSLPLQQAPLEIRLSPLCKLSWAEYLRRLEALKPFFSDNVLTAEAAIGASCRILRAGKAKNTSGSDSCTRFSMAQRLLLLIFLRKPYGTLSLAQLFFARSYIDRYVFGPEALPGVFAADTDVEWHPDAERLLRAFAYAVLQRHVLLSQGHWASGLAVIAYSGVTLARWYALILATLRPESGEPVARQVSREDMVSAIRLVERYYTGHQPRFLHFFSKRFLGMPLGWVLQSILPK